MVILDVNVLLYAYDQRNEYSGRVATWLEERLASDELIGVPWITVWGFVRISTNPRNWARPKTIREAWAVMDELLAQPNVRIINPASGHLTNFLRQLEAGRVNGSEATDAVLAALTIEQGAVLATSDRGFARFPDLRWVDPLGR